MRAMALGLVLLAAPGFALAINDHPRISNLVVSLSGPPNSDPTEAYVIGDVEFPPEFPTLVANDGQYDAERGEAGVFGVDAKALAIWQPSMGDPVLNFAMSLYDFRAVLPEVITWEWTFKLDGVPYKLQAGRGGLTMESTLQGGLSPFFTQKGLDAFRLLGPCNTSATSCPFFANVDGSLDTNAALVTWRVPINNPLFPGSAITPHTAGAATVLAVGPQQYRDRVTQTKTYRVASPKVEVWLAKTTGEEVTPRLEASVPPIGEGTLFSANLQLPSYIDKGPVGPTNTYHVVTMACARPQSNPVVIGDCSDPIRTVVKL